MRLVLGGVLARVRAGPLRSANKLKTLGSLLKFNHQRAIALGPVVFSILFVKLTIKNLTGPMLHYHTLRS